MKLSSVMQSPRRIAVLRALQLGDLIVAVPAFRALRARFPDAEITLIGLPWARWFVQRYHRYIDRFVEFPGYPGLPERVVDEEGLKHFFTQQRAYHYDIALQMHGSGRTSNAFVQSLGAEVMVGYYEGDENRQDALTFGMPYPTDRHEIMRNLELVALLGCTLLSTDLEFPLAREDYAKLAEVVPELAVRQERPWIAIHPGSRSPARRWPTSYYAQVADALATQWNAQIVLTGSTDETEIVQDVMHAMRTPAINLAGRTSLGALAALIEHVDLFISNDTGPAHIACAVDCPSIILFGPAEFSRWAPLDQSRHQALRHSVECSPCGYWECPIDHRCLRLLTPQTVLVAAEKSLTGIQGAGRERSYPLHPDTADV
jgi:lipopolysaccharide heptosyltransferase II